MSVLGDGLRLGTFVGGGVGVIGVLSSLVVSGLFGLPLIGMLKTILQFSLLGFGVWFVAGSFLSMKCGPM